MVKRIAAWQTSEGAIFASEEDAITQEAMDTLCGALLAFVPKAFPGWGVSSIYNVLLDDSDVLRKALNRRAPLVGLRAYCDERVHGWPDDVIYAGLRANWKELRKILNG